MVDDEDGGAGAVTARDSGECCDRCGVSGHARLYSKAKKRIRRLSIKATRKEMRICLLAYVISDEEMRRRIDDPDSEILFGKIRNIRLWW